MEQLELRKAVEESCSFAELAKKLGYNYCNGRILKTIKVLLNDNNYDTSHFTQNGKCRKKPKSGICERCCVKHDGTYGSGRFCCSKCARGFSTSKCRDEINDKVSKSLTGRKNPDRKNPDRKNPEEMKIVCEMCGTIVKKKWRYKQPKCCSRKCATKLRWQNPKYKQKMTNVQKKLVAEGKHKGWAKRKKGKPSYPENFFIGVLANHGYMENIHYKREKKEGMWFVDFAFEDKKFALEIDGKQHLQIERMKSDKKKDEFLRKFGWKIHRILWKSINSPNGQKYMKEQIDILLNLLNNH